MADPLPALLRASARFADQILGSVDSRLRNFPPSVAINLEPPEARLLMTAPDGSAACLTRATCPPDLGAAVAVFVTASIARLSDQWRVVIARGQVRLAVVVDLASGSAHLVADEGGAEPRTLAVLALQEVAN